MSNGEDVVRYKRTIQILILLLFVSGQSAGQPQPSWLFSPPHASDYIYGVGISPLFREDSLTYRNARLNAIQEITEQYRVKIISKRAEKWFGVRLLSYGYTVELIDSVYYLQCYRNARALDSLQTEDYAYILMAVSGDLSSPEQDLTISPASDRIHPTEPPVWVRKLPQREGFIYGLGISPRYMDENDSWDNSAKQARREIALTLWASRAFLEHENLTGKGTFYTKWSEAQTELVLERNRIIARWHDAMRQLYYTLIEYPLQE